jgi:hypothetical protein
LSSVASYSRSGKPEKCIDPDHPPDNSIATLRICYCACKKIRKGRKLDLISSTNPKFSDLRDKLLQESNASPIYSSLFTAYYEEYFNATPSRKLEFVVLNEETPTLLFLLHEFSSNALEPRTLSYFGLPGLLALNRKSGDEIHGLAINQVFNHLREIGFLNSLRNVPFEVIFPDLSTRSSKMIDKFASESSSAFVFFERVIDLRKSKSELFDDLSKSVKSAIKTEVSEGDTFKFVTHDSPLEVRKNAIKDLKELHFLSSGRVTRSEKTWGLQESQLEKGSLVIGLGYKEERLVHGAMYMISNSSAFYAVSANSKDIIGTSIAHPYIFDSILALKSLGIEKLYMGRQYEELTRELTEKEKNIAKFKSFFGGDLILGLGLSNA